MTVNRKQISKKVRFEVFKRDSFRCQYCGKSAPDVTLHVDHIKPVKNGGTNDILNIVTSCESCNLGKGAREIDDNSFVRLKKVQLDEINSRREQLEMMLKWREELFLMNEKQIDYICNAFNVRTGFFVNNQGRQRIAALLDKHGFELLLSAVSKSCSTYLKFKKDGTATGESVDFAFSKIGGVCVSIKLEEENPHLKDFYYIRGILRNKFYNVDSTIALHMIEQAFKGGASIEKLKYITKTSHSWTNWKDKIKEFIQGV